MYQNQSDAEEDHTKRLLIEIQSTIIYNEFIPNDIIDDIATTYHNILSSIDKYGSEHPLTLALLYHYCIRSIEIRFYHEAILILRRCVLSCKRCYGETHVEVAHFVTQLAISLSNNLQYTESIPYYKDALGLYEGSTIPYYVL